MSTKLGDCQVVFARRRYDVEIDLVLAGPGDVEGYPLVPGSPVAVAVVPPPEAWLRRRMLRVLSGWADAGCLCHAAIDFQDEEAVLTIQCGSQTVSGFVTDLDVLFAENVRERQDRA